MTRALRTLALVFGAVLAVPGGCGDEGDGGGASGTLGALATQNEVGRSGTYYLPSDSVGEALPLLVFFHGTDGNGRVVAEELTGLAESERFVVVAPDSRVAPDGRFAWEVGNAPFSRTADYTHTQALLDELTAMEGVVIDWDHALAAGHSGGAAMAPYLATNDARFDAYAVLHGGVVRGSVGLHRVPGWFSTGEADTLRSPEHVSGEAAYMRDDLGFEEVTVRTYPGGHQIGATERRELIAWWLGRE